MSEPKYILKANERVLIPKNNSFALYIVKKALWIIIAVLVIASLALRVNLFSEMSLGIKCLFVGLVILVIYKGGNKPQPSPFEMRFYEDYLVIYREKHYYDRKTSKMEYNKMYYTDIRDCDFNKKIERVTLHGVVEGTWYNYKKDGTLPQEPNYHKTTDSQCYFYTTFAQNIDIVAEIEQH